MVLPVYLVDSEAGTTADDDTTAASDGPADTAVIINLDPAPAPARGRSVGPSDSRALRSLSCGIP